MVRERKATRPKRATARIAKPASHRRAKPAGSIWETPHLKEIISQPVGSPMDLTPEEMRAIVEELIHSQEPYDKKKAERDLRELKKIRRMWGSALRDLDA